MGVGFLHNLLGVFIDDPGLDKVVEVRGWHVGVADVTVCLTALLSDGHLCGPYFVPDRKIVLSQNDSIFTIIQVSIRQGTQP